MRNPDGERTRGCGAHSHAPSTPPPLPSPPLPPTHARTSQSRARAARRGACAAPGAPRPPRAPLGACHLGARARARRPRRRPRERGQRRLRLCARAPVARTHGAAAGAWGVHAHHRRCWRVPMREDGARRPVHARGQSHAKRYRGRRRARTPERNRARRTPEIHSRKAHTGKPFALGGRAHGKSIRAPLRTRPVAGAAAAHPRAPRRRPRGPPTRPRRPAGARCARTGPPGTRSRTWRNGAPHDFIRLT